ncbi:MAG: hypothetical protein PVJ42_03120 [bacterium]
MPRSGLVALIIAIAAVLFCAVAADEAQAITKQQRPDYMVGVGTGLGRGDFNESDGSTQVYSEGGVALLRFGRRLGSKTMLAFDYTGWIIEFDESLEEPESGLFSDSAEDSTIIKTRRSQQQIALSIYVFPGNPKTATGGIYLRAGFGMSWAGYNEVPITPGAPQGHGDRTDDWGWGLSAEGGYEFWVSKNSTLGLGFFYNYMSLKEALVDDGWLAGGCVNFNVYF